MSKRVLIKYGEKEHLEKIEEGKIRFAPSQVYVKMEEDLHNKGQGDLLEGKFVFHAEGLKLTRTDTGETITLSGKQTSLDKGTQRKTTENELPSLTQCTA